MYQPDIAGAVHKMKGIDTRTMPSNFLVACGCIEFVFYSDLRRSDYVLCIYKLDETIDSSSNDIFKFFLIFGLFLTLFYSLFG